MMDMEEVISLTLRSGVLLSVILIVIGILLIFVNGGAEGLSISQLASGYPQVTTQGYGILQILSGIPALDGISFILLGLMVLIATPVVRVLLSVLHFALERNWLYTVITLIVLIDLLVAIFVIPRLVT